MSAECCPEAFFTTRQVIGRSKEVARVVQVLARRSKNNPILLGDPGVGKTAIAEGLARAIVTGPPSCATPEACGAVTLLCQHHLLGGQSLTSATATEMVRVTPR